MENILSKMIDERKKLKAVFEASLTEAPVDPSKEDPAQDDAPDGEDVVEPEEEAPEEEVPEEEPVEQEAPEITKEHLGHTEDTHFYLVSDTDDSGTTTDLLVVDQEGEKQYSAEEKGLDPADVTAFITQAYADLQIEYIENGVFMKYMYPEIAKEEEEGDLEDPEDAGEGEDMAGGVPAGSLEDEEGELEEEPEFAEEEMPLDPEPKPKKKKKPAPAKESVVSEESSFIPVEFGGEKLRVSTEDDGTGDLVILINGKEFRQSEEFADLFRDEETGQLSKDGLKELALDIVATMDDETWEQFKSGSNAPKAEPVKRVKVAGADESAVYSVHFKDKQVVVVEGAANSGLALQFASARHKSIPVRVTEGEWEDKMPGGLADESDPEDFPPDQLDAGVRVEMEHTDNPEVAKEIAMDHLKEDPQYYTKLAKMEAGECDEA